MYKTQMFYTPGLMYKVRELLKDEARRGEAQVENTSKAWAREQARKQSLTERPVSIALYFRSVDKTSFVFKFKKNEAKGESDQCLILKIS